MDVCITYGSKIYIPRGGGLADHVIPHEEVHERQQAAFPGGIEAWWQKYLESAEFRFQEELEAYRVQVKVLAGYSRQERRSIIKKLARDLAGPMYGNMVSTEEALKLITQ